MKLKILDTRSNEARECESNKDFDYWAKGAGACDCARALLAFPEQYDKKCCTGPLRYIIIETDYEGDLSKIDALVELNYEYPIELLEKHGIFEKMGVNND